ncbi:MAG: Lrp/AsnC family transcriptional regulator [Candidatus Bathyarchaeota archaeon]|nr:Lrp/AsnC family transcriptional regulator [Candidatus Bathyarchaeum sp.]
MGTRPKIDKIDIIILKALLKDARTPYVDIAKRCGISSNSVKFRVDRLKMDGIITGSITQINPKALGYNYIAFIPIQACANEINSVHEFLKKTPNMVNVLVEMGAYNLNVVVALEQIEQINEVIGYIRTNPNVVSANALIVWEMEPVDHLENLTFEEYEG